MAQNNTNRLAYLMATAAFNWGSHTIRMGLLKSSYTPTAAQIRALNVANDLTPGTNEISVSGYARQTVGSKTTTEVDASDRVELDCADVTFTALVAGQTFDKVFFIKFGTNDTDSEVLGVYDVTATPTNGGDVTITIDSTGAIHVRTV